MPKQPALRPLSRRFFADDPATVAKAIIGKTLVRRYGDKLLAGKIVEAEAYLGEHDPAAHASHGRTKRTEVMYGNPGHVYVYNIHGHVCLNIVSEVEGTPGCVLIRAVEPLLGIDEMYRNRGREGLKLTQLANGPGKLCKAMRIGMDMYGVDVTAADSGLEMCQPIDENPLEIVASRRIGITKAAEWELRFTLLDSPFTSR
jgi:DNA-3-methyladenine glycosylase